jgi:hypothetical protein
MFLNASILSLLSSKAVQIGRVKAKSVHQKIKCLNQNDMFQRMKQERQVKSYGKNDGLRKGMFDIYVDEKCSSYRSIFYHQEFKSIKAVYGEDDNMDLLFTCISIESSRKPKLWQFRLRGLNEYMCYS